jgi:hypothetical protein
MTVMLARLVSPRGARVTSCHLVSLRVVSACVTACARAGCGCAAITAVAWTLKGLLLASYRSAAADAGVAALCAIAKAGDAAPQAATAAAAALRLLLTDTPHVLTRASGCYVNVSARVSSVPVVRRRVAVLYPSGDNVCTPSLTTCRL